MVIPVNSVRDVCRSYSALHPPPDFWADFLAISRGTSGFPARGLPHDAAHGRDRAHSALRDARSTLANVHREGGQRGEHEEVEGPAACAVPRHGCQECPRSITLARSPSQGVDHDQAEDPHPDGAGGEVRSDLGRNEPHTRNVRRLNAGSWEGGGSETSRGSPLLPCPVSISPNHRATAQDPPHRRGRCRPSPRRAARRRSPTRPAGSPGPPRSPHRQGRDPPPWRSRCSRRA